MVSEIAQFLANEKKDKDAIKEQFGGEVQGAFVIARTDRCRIETGPSVFSEVSVGTAFIFDTNPNDTLDDSTYKLDGAGSITAGVIRVINYNNTFKDYLRDTQFVNTTNSTATVNTGTFTITF